MSLTLFNIHLLLPAFLLVLFRIGGLTLATPFFSSQAVPARVKTGFAVAVAFMVFPIVMPNMPAELSLGMIVTAVFGELLIGLGMGLALGIVFMGVRLAGMIIGQQAGIMLGQVANPMLEGQTTIIGQLYSLVAMMLFLSIGGHRAIMTALLDTFQVIPPGSVRYDASILDLFEGLLTGAFGLGLRLAGPVVIALFMTELTMGFIARTIPQLNILSIGFSVRIFIGLSAAAISLAAAYDLLYDSFVGGLDAVRVALGLGG